ncbi:tRNA 2-selenouridine synthase [Halanaerobium saccharolyticum]|uniref:tRNA 2-selenouridine synthase n=1 Tax=Halanaerobium saccharolyticum TaxID=43595 RepID=A0A4V3G5V8_9FIRM|nr:tRNA 2-selenouridine(34) synthase MnmH [Halanaerobium saccharolyticum]RAK10488.1 tRNA 2-selenouridine synthase [Halanaerobium saccharolyticum]TDW06755.1 tRNA 2-selenouridine synthase [Halanaerobium saccharolyticum]TDX62390.1 tRNA 2-selenouridine synthase [Halanaerobium saccharolyticum]
MRKERLITYQESLKLKNSIYIDARTKTEYQEATIPGAVNIELLNHDERKIIGTIYKHQSPKKAKLKGVELVSPKIPDLIAEVNQLAQNYDNLIIFCSRGGLRSKSLAEFSDLAGIEVYRLEGGYKNYRHYIMDQLENYKFKGKIVVLHGNTGVGKTYILKELEKLGANIIDLEGIANHRGSAFGSIGLQKPYNQKYFESLLWNKLKNKDQKNDFIFVEAESRRVGHSVIPEFFNQNMKAGDDLLITASMKKRVENIYLEYIKDIESNQQEFIERVLESLTAIKKYIIKKAGKNSYYKLLELAEAANFKELTKLLLEEYYDPMYEHSQNKVNNYRAEIQAEDIKRAALKIKNLYQI